MSATTTSTDPVQAVIDLLSGTAQADWPGGSKPDPIEEQWASTFRTKNNRSSAAAYVWSTDVGTRDNLGAEYDTVQNDELVGVDVWAPDETEANDVAGDVIAILEDYATDLKQNTPWVTIRPTEADDRRAETIARRADQAVVSVSVDLMRTDSTGT